MPPHKKGAFIDKLSIINYDVFKYFEKMGKNYPRKGGWFQGVVLMF